MIPRVAKKLGRKWQARAEQMPLIGPWVRRHSLESRYRVELDLLYGRERGCHPHPSVVHFSFYRAATQYVKQVLARCALEEGMRHADFNQYSWDTTFPYLDSLSPTQIAPYRHVFKPQGYFYGVFGGWVREIPQLERYRVVLTVRDPRDILVSLYFSMAYSHAAPPRESAHYVGFLQSRDQARRHSIDTYVLAESDRLLTDYRNYATHLVGRHPRLHIARYEEMTASFSTWLKNLLAACELDPSLGLRRRLIEEFHAMQPAREDVHQHVRLARPGDYLAKLRPETIALLNAKFAPVLDLFGYGDVPAGFSGASVRAAIQSRAD